MDTGFGHSILKNLNLIEKIIVFPTIASKRSGQIAYSHHPNKLQVNF